MQKHYTTGLPVKLIFHMINCRKSYFCKRLYGIIKQHAGYINCYSEPGHGPIFKIYLPAIQTELDSKPPIFETDIPGGTETVLLVDDDDNIRDLGATLLIDFGYKVITANDGKEALEIYQRESNSISLIILDLIMPVMDGRSAWQRFSGSIRTQRLL